LRGSEVAGQIEVVFLPSNPETQQPGNLKGERQAASGG
jgi:hypothetical protein